MSPREGGEPNPAVQDLARRREKGAALIRRIEGLVNEESPSSNPVETADFIRQQVLPALERLASTLDSNPR